MASFSQLPVELVEHIFGYLEQPNLSAVSQLTKNSRTLAIPLLYRKVDLSLPPGEKVPRIDRFCLAILQNARLAAHVESLTIGPQPGGEGYQGQRWLPHDNHFNDELMMELATKVLEQETLSQEPDFFKDAIAMREYAAFAALILFVLPTLQRLHLSEFKCAIMDRVFSIFRNLEDGPSWVRRRPSEAFLHRLSNITSVSMNVDKTNGISYVKDTRRLDLGDIFYLPGIQEIELSLPVYSMAGPAPMHFPTWRARNRLLRNVVPTSITRVVIRTSVNSLHVFNHFFESMPKLRSFTYEFFHDLADAAGSYGNTIDLQAWTDALPKTLEELTLSVEYCQTSVYPFCQPKIGDALVAYLDLTNFTCLHTLELPLPFLTGDPNFSMSTEIYPLLPPNLIHLCLRTDLTHAHHSFPFDSSNLSTGLSFQESGDEARLKLNARMDLSYMFHAALTILSFATKLETYSIWQPADASLNWFDGQIDEFAQACYSRSVIGHILYPMLLRHKKPEQWNLVKDVMVSHPDRSPAGLVDELYRGERFGVPLGLACQYHLHALRKRQVRRR